MPRFWQLPERSEVSFLGSDDDPEYQAAFKAFSAALSQADRRICSAGVCSVYVDTLTGESLAEFGPAECPCQDGDH